MPIIFNLFAVLEAAIAIALGFGSISLLGPVAGLAVALPLIIAAQLYLEYRGMGGRLFWLPTISATSLLGSLALVQQLGLSAGFALVGMMLAVVASRVVKTRGEQSRQPGGEPAAG